MERGKKYKLSGPGIEKAIEEARAKGMNVSFVYEQNDKGELVKVGYFLVEKGKISIRQPEVKWIRKEEWTLT